MSDWQPSLAARELAPIYRRTTAAEAEKRAREYEGGNYGDDPLTSLHLDRMRRKMDVEAAKMAGSLRKGFRVGLEDQSEPLPAVLANGFDLTGPLLDLHAKYRQHAARALAEAKAAGVMPDEKTLNEEAQRAAAEIIFNRQMGECETDERRGPLWPEAWSVAEDGMESGVLLAREETFRRICERESGRIISEAVAQKKQAARELLREQDETLGAMLEETGLKMRYDETERLPTAIIPLDDLSAPIWISNLRRVNFFAEQAAMRRAPLIRLLTYFLGLPGNEWCRMMTVTSGSRWRDNARLGRLKIEKRAFHKALSDLSREDWFKAVGQVVFMGFEFGQIEWSPESFDFHVHLHAHLAWRPHGRIGLDEWITFKGLVGDNVARAMHHGAEFVGPVEPVVLSDDGVIDNPREFAKYPVKPVELEKLIRLGGPDTVRRFFDQTFGMRLVSTFGPLRELAKEMDDAGEHLVWESTPDGTVLVRELNHNAGRRPVDRERMKSRALMRRRVKAASRQHDRLARKNRAEMTAEMRAVMWRLVRVDAEIRWLENPKKGGLCPDRENRLENARKNRKPLIARLKTVAETAPSVAISFMENRPEWVKKRAEYWGIWEIAAETVARFAVCEAETENGNEAEKAENDPKKAVSETENGAEKAENGAETENGKETEKIRPPVKNRILARLAPAAYRGRVTVPALVVVGFDGNASALAERPEVAAMLAAHGAQLATASRIAPAPYTRERVPAARGRAPVMEVHTIHATRQTSAKAWHRIPVTPLFVAEEALAGPGEWARAAEKNTELVTA
jgi:hypothetical protein